MGIFAAVVSWRVFFMKDSSSSTELETRSYLLVLKSVIERAHPFSSPLHPCCTVLKSNLHMVYDLYFYFILVFLSHCHLYYHWFECCYCLLPLLRCVWMPTLEMWMALVHPLMSQSTQRSSSFCLQPGFLGRASSVPAGELSAGGCL